MSLEEIMRKHIQEAAKQQMRFMETKLLEGCHECGRRMIEFDGDTPVKSLGNWVVCPDGREFPLCFKCLHAIGATNEP